MRKVEQDIPKIFISRKCSLSVELFTSKKNKTLIPKTQRKTLQFPQAVSHFTCFFLGVLVLLVRKRFEEQDRSLNRNSKTPIFVCPDCSGPDWD